MYIFVNNTFNILLCKASYNRHVPSNWTVRDDVVNSNYTYKLNLT